MSEQNPQNSAHFDAAATAEFESVDWVTLRLKQTVCAIGITRSETALTAIFIRRFRRMRCRQRLQRFGITLASGTGFGVGAGSVFDIEWLELMNSLLNWVGLPMALKLSQLPYVFQNWIA